MLVTSVSEYQDVVADVSWGLMQHATNFTRLYYIQGGEAYYRDDETFFQFETGKLYLLPVEKDYMLYHNPQKRLKHLYCHITTTPKIITPLVIDIEENSFTHDAILLLKKHIKSNDVTAVLKCIDLIITTIPEEFFLGMGTTTIVLQIKKYIDDKLQEEISLETLASKFGYSKAHLIKVFKEAYGIPPIQYLQQRRIEESIALLREGYSIEEVAEKFYYSSASNFSVFFKKRYGLSPKNYIKMLNSDRENAKKFL